MTKDRGIRAVRDAMSRDILHALDEAGINVASTTFEITGLPPLRVETPFPVAPGGNGRPGG